MNMYCDSAIMNWNVLYKKMQYYNVLWLYLLLYTIKTRKKITWGATFSVCVCINTFWYITQWLILICATGRVNTLFPFIGQQRKANTQWLDQYINLGLSLLWPYSTLQSYANLLGFTAYILWRVTERLYYCYSKHFVNTMHRYWMHSVTDWEPRLKVVLFPSRKKATSLNRQHNYGSLYKSPRWPKPCPISVSQFIVDGGTREKTHTQRQNLQGILNVTADLLSSHYEWQLNMGMFQYLDQVWAHTQ